MEGQETAQLHRQVARWYADHARDLPWRREGVSPWGVLVSEVMLQQTPVVRVQPVWEEWLHRWPRPIDLAAASGGDAVRAWGKLGYPRRALRLREAAVAIGQRFDGAVPASYDELRSLAGVGDYTAAAVAAFAYHQREVVLDTNVRRVLTRVIEGRELPPASVRRGERDLAARLLPDSGEEAARWSVGVMEIGALLCRPVSPRCDTCPLADDCAWRGAGHPPDHGPPRKVQGFAGTDRQCRGRLLDVLRQADGPVHIGRLQQAWHLPEQRDRALAGLIEDGLVVAVGPATYSLPE